MLPVRSRLNVPAFPLAELPLRRMREEMATLLHHFFPIVEESDWRLGWETDVEEKENEVLVRAEMPGFEPAEVKVEVVGDRLTIWAEHKDRAAKANEKEDEERAVTRVRRVLTLPAAVDPEKAEALYRNGVLEVRVPRKPEAMARRIEVKA